MQKLLFLPLFALLVASCSNDFDVAAPWKEIPVVYGLLSPQDTAHYIRIEKAFLDASEGAQKVAQKADSLYYPANAIQVFIEEKGRPQSRRELVRVNGDDEGIVREGGIFASSPNWLYKFKTAGGSDTLVKEKPYLLTIVRADGRPNITSETTLPRNFSFRVPDPTGITAKMQFVAGSTFTVDLRTDANGVLFNLKMIIRYADEDANGVPIAHHSFVWDAAKNVARENNAIGAGANAYRCKIDLTANNFFNALIQNVPPPPANTFRRFELCEMIVEGGGSEIKKAIDAAIINGGLTGAEVNTYYTNISEGYGIFSGKNQVTLDNIQFSPETVFSMNENAQIKTLNFRN